MKKTTPPPICPDCGKPTRRTGQRSSCRGICFECLNPECGVIEIRVRKNRNRVIRVAMAEM